MMEEADSGSRKGLDWLATERPQQGIEPSIDREERKLGGASHLVEPRLYSKQVAIENQAATGRKQTINTTIAQNPHDLRRETTSGRRRAHRQAEA